MATPLLLVVHGRTGGVIPEVYQRLARELEQRRQAPVGLRALTAPMPVPLPAPGEELALWGPGLTLVPLLLLPGNHARVDVPSLARRLRSTAAAGLLAPGSGVRRLPFLGAWPAWQSALAAELAALADSSVSGGRVKAPPLLLHHPLEGPLALRYLEHLQRRLGCRCLAAPYSSADSEEPALAIDGPVLPLSLAANRLTERLEPRLGRAQAAPLLERPRLRQLLLEHLVALP
ncbi:MAG: hypothetical protein NTY67_04245 [Cyanobacteria bacterium]|nr:hypothetical protein [Cyanobacteriota bacterium]